MSVATYDNPATMCRECWQDGKLLCHYAMALFFLERPIPARYFFYGANIGPWKTGQLWGDRAALTAGADDAKGT